MKEFKTTQFFKAFDNSFIEPKPPGEGYIIHSMNFNESYIEPDNFGVNVTCLWVRDLTQQVARSKTNNSSPPKRKVVHAVIRTDTCAIPYMYIKCDDGYATIISGRNPDHVKLYDWGSFHFSPEVYEYYKSCAEIGTDKL